MPRLARVRSLRQRHCVLQASFEFQYIWGDLVFKCIVTELHNDLTSMKTVIQTQILPKSVDCASTPPALLAQFRQGYSISTRPFSFTLATTPHVLPLLYSQRLVPSLPDSLAYQFNIHLTSWPHLLVDLIHWLWFNISTLAIFWCGHIKSVPTYDLELVVSQGFSR